MLFCFQDKENIYLSMDLLTGGDLRFHVSKYKKFSEEQTRFFVCCVLLALEYTHTNNILHRDIKPENLVLDEKGYVRLTDYGIAKVYQKENSSETSGTPGYMAPEVMCAQNHTIAVDYFALGVMTYEFMIGKRPYLGKSRKEIKEQILARQAQIKKTDIPEGWSIEAADFANKLLQRKPANRMGLRGAQEVKDHVWLKNYPWKDLYDKRINAPFVPKLGDNFDAHYTQKEDKLGQNTRENYENLIRRNTIQEYFKNFTFLAIEDQKKSENTNTKSSNNSSTNEKKFLNPHSNLVSSSTSTEDSRMKTAEKQQLQQSNIENKLSKYKSITNSASSLVFKGLKKSNSSINYIKKPGSLSSQNYNYYNQN